MMIINVVDVGDAIEINYVSKNGGRKIYKVDITNPSYNNLKASLKEYFSIKDETFIKLEATLKDTIK